MIKVDKIAETEAILKTHNITDYKVSSNGEINIFENLKVNDIVAELNAANVTILSINSSEESVEEYYLNLVKEGK